MTQTLLNAVQSLIERFPGKHLDPTDRTAAKRYLQNYIEDLEDLPEPLVVSAILRLRKSSTFMPAVAEIRLMVVEACCGLPSEDEAWKIVKAQLAARTQNDGLGPWDVHPLVLEAVRLVGTHELRNDEKGFVQHRFREIYKERRAKFVTDLQSGAIPLDVSALPGSTGLVALERRTA